jgi:hypothetical protein
MRIAWNSIIVVVATISTVHSSAAQTKKPPKVIALTGCVERDEKTPDQFTITDPQAGGTYRVSGKDFGEFVGRRIQVDGTVVKGVAIKGGLQPTPNIAAQAGALDPSRAAVQAATAGTAAKPTAETPEFRVKTIHPAGGACQ